jgi:hypothetical protein
MLIADLYDYANAHGLGLTPYINRKLTHRLVLNRDGYVDLIEIDEIRPVPFVTRTSGVKANPLHDTAPYVLGLSGGKSDQYGQKRFQTFWDRTEALMVEAGDTVALKAVQALRADKSWPKQAAKKIGDGVWIAVALGETLLLDRPLVKKHLEEVFAKTMAAEGEDSCMITGERCVGVATHDPIVGVPGTNSNGCALISFNDTTATQGRLKQGANFTVSYKAMKGYTAAFNDILRTAKAEYGPFKKPGREGPLYGTCGVFWGSTIAASIAIVTKPFSTQDEREKAWAEIEAHANEGGDIHMLFLKGSKGRIAVLSYEIRPARTVAQALLRFRRYFDGPHRGHVSVGGAVLQADVRERDLIAGTLRVEVVRSCLVGAPLPGRFVNHLLNTFDPTEPVRDKFLLRWLEFYNLLKPKDIPTMDLENKPQLSNFVYEDDDNQAYILGRLIALEYAIKQTAHKRRMPIAPTLASLARACRTPAAYVERFVHMVSVYEDMITRRNASRELSRLAREVARTLRPALGQQTTPLSLMERAAVYQGYYHQTAYNIALKSFRWEERKRKAEESEAEEAA